MSLAYSLSDPRVLDTDTRRVQAEKIWRVMAHFAHAHAITLADARCLDMGCSSGVITRALAAHMACVVGVDVDWNALCAPSPALPRSQQTLTGEGVQLPSPVPHTLRDGGGGAFAAASGLALPFVDASFDVAVCNQVYQYVGDVPRVFAELARVLRRGGFCYFSARNLWGIAARENWLPFVAALSPALARLAERAVSPERNWRHRAGTLWSYRKLHALAAQHFVVHDYTTRVLRDPTLSDLFVPARYRALLARAPQAGVALLKPILPTHIWILQKP